VLILLVSTALSLTLSRGVAWADDVAKPRRFVVHPMPVSDPPLRYQLLPGLLDRLPGNAAVDYGKVTAEQRQFFTNDKLAKQIVDWSSAPLEELRRDHVLEKIPTGWIYDTLVRAGQRATCDWQVPIREKGQGFFRTLLPDIQQSRTFARYLSAKSRAEIAEGRLDQSMETLRAGFALGQNVGKTPFLVGTLVGLAISEQMAFQLGQFVQQPEAPNLYWTLTALPRPLIDGREAIEAEVNALYLSFPELAELDKLEWSAEQWQEFLDRFLASMAEIFRGQNSLLTQDQLAATASALKNYPMAKQYLIDHGYSPQTVEAMPIPKVVLLYTMKTFNYFRDMSAAPFFLPFPEAQQLDLKLDKELRRFLSEGRAILWQPYNILPALQAARMVVARIDREIALLRVIEAIRIHGAAHQGQLPAKLAEIAAVPVPLDPFTEKPFEYELRGDTAVLQGPPVYDVPFVVEIQFAK
jgi:hypothetical protein